MDDDLDAELARLEEEIQNDETEEANELPNKNAAVADSPSVPENEPNSDGDMRRGESDSKTVLVETHPSRGLNRLNLEMEGSTRNPISSDDAILLAAKDPVVRKQAPEWQRELLERDYERIHGRNIGTTSPPPAGPIGPANRNYRPGAPSAMGGERPGLSNTRTASISAGPSTYTSGAAAQPGQWVWNGAEWIFEPEIRTAVAPLPAQSGITADVAAVPRVRPAAQDSASKHFIPSHQENAEPCSDEHKNPRHVRSAAGTVWVDPTMDEWPEDDFRIFVGDLATDATEEELTGAFKKFPSFNMARVVMDKRTGESKGYGFVSFAKGEDMVRALREMNGKYVGTRPVKLKKSNWHKKELTADRKKDLKIFKSAGLISKRHSKLP
jgi:hypothetical protein